MFEPSEIKLVITHWPSVIAFIMAFSAFFSIVFLQPAKQIRLNMIRSGFIENGLTKYKFAVAYAIDNLPEKRRYLQFGVCANVFKNRDLLNFVLKNNKHGKNRMEKRWLPVINGQVKN